MFSTNYRSTTVLTVASVVFIAGEVASTVTLSEVAPTGRTKFRATALCTFRTTSALMIVLKPGFETWTW
jgi:hypothetical protein